MSKKVGKKKLVFRFFPIIYNILIPFYFSFIVKSVKQSLEQTAANCIKKKVLITLIIFSHNVLCTCETDV